MTQEQINELKEIYRNLLELRDEAYQLYSEVIDAIAHGGRPTKEQLDEIIDGLLEYWMRNVFSFSISAFADLSISSHRNISEDTQAGSASRWNRKTMNRVV